MSDTLRPTTESPERLVERPVVTDPTSENIAASVDYRWLNTDLALPQTIDEAEALYGCNPLYERMVHHPDLAAPIRLIKARVLKGGVSVAPSHKAPSPDEEDSAEKAEKQRKHDQAVDCADFVRYCLGKLRKPGERISDVLYEMLDCLYLGNRLAEINTDLEAQGQYAGQRVLTSVRPKPRENYAYVVRSLGGVVGIAAVVPGLAPYIRQGIVYDPASLPNMIAPDKVMVFRFGGKNGNPNGESVFRDAYDAWLCDQQDDIRADKLSAQFAGGRVYGVIDPAAEGKIDPTAIARTLSGWMPGMAICLPKGVTPMIDYPEIDPDWFDFRQRTNRERMMQAVIINARQILSAARGSEKDSGVAQDVGDDIFGMVKELAQSALESQLFYSLTLWRSGKEIADEFCPKAILGSSISPDFAQNLNALGTVGYTLDDSQVIPMEESIGAPVRRADWQQIRDEKAAAQQKQEMAMQKASQPTEKTFRRAGQPKKAA